MTKFNCPKISFNTIANAISVASGVTLAGIIGVGSYVYLNKDAIIDDIKDAAIESVVGGMGGGAIGGALTGPGLDLPTAGENAAAGGTSASLGLPVPGGF